MSLFRSLARGYLLDRMMRGGRHRHRRYGHAPRYGFGHSPRYYGHRRRPRGRTGFFGPFPYYSRRTRGGGRVSVGGCCLPIPLVLAIAMSAVGLRARRRS